jgi:hypothetical protein
MVNPISTTVIAILFLGSGIIAKGIWKTPLCVVGTTTWAFVSNH